MFLITDKKVSMNKRLNHEETCYKILDTKDGIEEWWFRSDLVDINIFGSNGFNGNEFIVSKDVRFVILFKEDNKLVVALISSDNSIVIDRLSIDSLCEVYREGYSVYKFTNDWNALCFKLSSIIKKIIVDFRYSFISNTEKKYIAKKKLLDGIEYNCHYFKTNENYASSYNYTMTDKGIVYYYNSIASLSLTEFTTDKDNELYPSVGVFSNEYLTDNTNNDIYHTIYLELCEDLQNKVDSILKKYDLYGIISFKRAEVNSFVFSLRPEFYYNNSKLLN